MAQNYKAGLIITGDASGGIRAIKATEDELGKLNQGFDRGSRQSKRFGSDAARAGQQLTEIDRGASVATRGLETLRRAAAPIAGVIAGMFAANTIQSQVDWGDQLQKTNLRIGASTEALSQYNYVAKLSGVEFGQLTTAWQRQTRRIAEAAQGTGVASKALERLNLNAAELNRLAPEEQFERIATAMQNVESSSERVALAQKLWDSEGVKLVQIVNSGTDAIAAMRAEADALGLTISQDTANAMASYNDEVDRLKFAAQGLSQTLAAELVPSMTSGLQVTSAFIQEIGGAETILGTARDAAALFAAVMAGRYAAAFAASAKEVATKTAATVANTQAEIAATAAARAKAAETLRLATAEQAAAKRAYENSRAIAAATGNTTLRTRAITQMAAANQRAIAAEAAHTAAVNANSAAMARGTVAAQAMAGASRAGAAALALVGGPLGAAVLAGGAIYYFREELGLVAPKIQTATERVDDMTSALDANSEAALKNARAMLEAEQQFQRFRQTKLAMDVERQQQVVSAEQEQWDRVGGQQAFGMGQRSEAQQKLHDLRLELLDTRKAIEAAGGSVTEIDEKLEQLERTTREATASTVELGETTGAASKATREAAKETTTLANAYENLLDRIQPNRRAARQYAQDVGVLNLALATGRMNTVQYMQAMGQLQESFQAAQRETDKTAKTSEDASQRIANSFLSWETVADNTLRRVDDTGKDLWLGFIDGSESALDAVKRGFQQTLAEIAHMLTTQRLTFHVAGMMGLDTTGMPGASGAGGFNLNSIGSLQNGWNTVSGWFGGSSAAAAGTAPIGYASGFGAQAATGTYTGWAGSAAAGAANPGMFASMGGISGIAGGLGAGYMGMQLGNQLAPDAKYGNAAGGLGAVGGFLLGGPLGAAIGGTIGASISKGLFGGSWQTKDGGLNLGVSGGDITGNQYEYQRKSGGLFKGSSYRTQTSALDSEFESALQQAYSAQEASLAITLDVLGQQSSSLNAFSTGLTKISTKGKSEAEVEQAVQDWLQNIVNRAAQSVVDPAEYALAGETTVETLNRLATALTGVNPLLEQLHGSAYEASLAGGDAAASLVALSGGMEQFAQRAEFYYQNFYTEAERQEAAMTQAAKAMGAFTARTGEIVTTTDQLRDLVDGIDRNSEAGRELYAAAMQLAPALVEVEQGLERVRDRFADMLTEAESALGSAEQQALSAWQAFENQSFKQQITLLESVGDSQAALALQRERELLSIDPLLHETQRVIWSIEDETQAKNGAAQAAQRYVNELARVRDQLANTLGNINQWIDQRNATSGTPGLNLTEAGDQFARQLILAQSGDRSALQSITQYADQYLTAGEAMYASGGAFQRIQQDVLDALQDLPDQISAEEYLAQEIRDALQEAVSQLPGGIAESLHPMFDAIDLDASGLIDWDEFYSVFAGMASDEELRRIFAKLDADGSGTISRLEALGRTSEGTEDNTKTLEERARDQLDSLGGLVGEMSRTTDQFVGLNSNIVSLRDSINALGVAQEEVARIERERAAAEQAERERIQREREQAARVASLETDAQQSLADMQEWQRQAQATVLGNTPNQTLSQRRVDDLTGVLKRFAGNDQMLSAEELQRALAHSQSQEQWSQRDRAFFNRSAKAAFAESQYHQQMGNAAALSGGSYSGSVNFGYLGDQEYLNSLSTAERARLYVERYADLQKALATGASYGQTTPEAWGEYHYNRWGKNEGRMFAKGGVFTNSVVHEPTAFDLGWMGEAGPEAIVPLSRGAGGRLGIDATGLMQLPDGPLELPMPNVPMPQFPALDNRDVVQVLQDLRSENKQLRADINRLLGDVKTNTSNTANAVASSASRAEQQRRDQLEEQRAATRAARLKGRTV
ncbi:EF-hand domain-containing protein [Vreelandella nanhaiensis]|uniref:EF-hand domain-containing protein n=1 Tax=Vreelandella nanhaiensis TaxID=1258546 RepID=A0A433KXU3_9GAMM|nr:EF-hand domain-containing protein [Halomonas nanhaiensis]RUR34469.1 hypothetical protein ELY38_02445 [Halomonas nanhaiensis]